MPFGSKLLGHSAPRSWGVKALMPSMPTCSPSPCHGGEGQGGEHRLRLLSWGGHSSWMLKHSRSSLRRRFSSSSFSRHRPSMTLRASRLLLIELRASTVLHWLPCALSRPLGCLLEAG